MWAHVVGRYWDVGLILSMRSWIGVGHSPCFGMHARIQIENVTALAGFGNIPNCKTSVICSRYGGGLVY